MKKKFLTCFLILAALGIIISSCKKTTVAPPVFHTINLQPENGDDVSTFYLVDSLGDSSMIDNQNFYGDSILYVNAFTSDSEQTGSNIFVRFDSATSLPSTAKILVATLYLYGTDSSYILQSSFGNTVPGGGNSYFSELNDSLEYYDSIAHVIYNTSADSAYDNTLLVQQISSAWNARTITYNMQPTLTTFASTTGNTIMASTSQWDYNISIDVTSLVQQWFQNPSSNFGISLSILNKNYGIPFTYINHQMVFYSSSATNPIKRPELVIVYQ